jgi:basic amino acid/polyamine antiporter, APA family
MGPVSRLQEPFVSPADCFQRAHRAIKMETKMPDALRRSLSLPQLIFYGVGSMIGAGIYSVIGAAAGEAGQFLWISFALAAVAAFLTVLSYAELVSALPKTGAEYQFLKAAFPERPAFAFMAGYLIAINAAATSATVSLAFGGYLAVFLPAPQIATALGLLVLCTAVNILGIRQSAWFGIALVCVEVAGLLLMIGAGFVAGEPSRSLEAMPRWQDAGGIFAATALIFFVYIGFEDVANLAEETKEPKRNVPRALLASVIITSVIYLLVALAVIGISDAEALGQSDSPLTLAGSAAAPWIGQALAISALFATASTALISLVSISRLLFGMARDGDMPRPLAATLPFRKTPWIAALALFGVACLLLPLGEVKIVASVSSFGVLLVFAAVQAAAIRLRFTQPHAPRAFTVPLSIGRFPILPAVGIAIVLALVTQFAPLVYLVGGGAIGAGILIYLVHRRWGGTNAGK